MKITELTISGVKLLEPKVFHDGRGYFLETFNKSLFLDLGLSSDFVQDNHSNSKKGVLRGLHFQMKPYAQGKLVRVVKGSVLDVVVDIDPESKTFGQHLKVKLSAANHKMLWVPPTCAHGFLSLQEDTVFLYKCTNEYHKSAEKCIKWNDPKLAIDWEFETPTISEKDNLGEFFLDINFSKG